MTFQVSPGVNVSEINLTTVVPAQSTTEAAFAGNFSKGPTNQRILINSEDRLVQVFGEPNDENYKDWFSAANFLAYGNTLYVVRVPGTGALNAVDAGGTAALVENKEDFEENHSTAFAKFVARTPGVEGNSIKVAVCANQEQWDGGSGSFADATDNDGGAYAAGGINAGANTFTIEDTLASVQEGLSVGDIIVVGTSNIAISALAAATGNAAHTTVTLASNVTDTVANIGAVRKYTGSAWEYQNNFNRAPITTEFGEERNVTGDAIHIAVIDEDGSISGTRGQVLETFEEVSLAADAKTTDGASNYFGSVINENSEYIWFGGTPLTATGSGDRTTGSGAVSSFGGTTATAESYSLAGGVQGTTPTPAQRVTGYDLFKSPEDVDVSIVIAGEADVTLANHLIDNIAEYRKDCVVCISPERADVVNNSLTAATDIVAFRNTLSNSSYAIIDSGWKYQYDKYNDTYRYVPLNADVAGTLVNTDSTRDPWHSPAGFNRGHIKNSIKLAFNPNKTERDVLYKAGVNPVTTFTGQGTVLYGDKTMTGHSNAFDRINVRRLFIVLEKAIANASRFMLFEINDEFTRAQFKNLVEPFLRDVKGRRGIYDFQVVCDETNNDGEVIDRNEFVGHIFIKPARAINYIRLRFVATRTGVEFSEIVGRAA